jgi:DNA-directed RNA polymerase subunit RPC12/RpoP
VGLFKKKRDRDGAPVAPPPASPSPAPPPSAITADLPTAGDALPASLAAHSEFVKRASCARCGADKRLPSTTAYLYCDFCGALVDYDFRIANADTNAGITNTVYHRLTAPLQADLARAKATGDRDAYRALQYDIFRQWLELCPQAASPRARTDLEFRERLITYFVESTVTKDMDPEQQQLDARMATMIASLQRIPTPGGAWMVAGDFWPMAALWKHQMDLAYAAIRDTGVAAIDPDDPPPGVAVRMEYSTFCQAWLPHLSGADGQRLLAEFGLTGDYTKVVPQPTEVHRCGSCGSDLRSVVGARVIVCESCGHQVDIAGGDVPCRNCGAPLTYPVAVNRLNCPFCKIETARV